MAKSYDEAIGEALGDYLRAESGTVAPPGGAAGARHTIVRRRRLRVALAGALGVVALAVPVALLAGKPARDSLPPVTGTPSPSASPAPSERDGRLTIEQLTSQEVDLPSIAQRCPSGRYKMDREKRIEAQAPPWLIKVAHANLDADPALETAALVQCVSSELQEAAVVSFDVDALGAVVMRDLVVKGALWDVVARDEGGVSVDISDIGACCDGYHKDYGAELHQQRGYAWTGSGLAQVAGPTRFAAHDGQIDLKLTLLSVSWSEPFRQQVGGEQVTLRQATVRLRATNLSTVTSGPWMVFPDGDARGVSGIGFHQPGLAGGAGADLTVELTQHADRKGSFPIALYELGVNEIGGDLHVEDNSVRINNPSA